MMLPFVSPSKQDEGVIDSIVTDASREMGEVGGLNIRKEVSAVLRMRAKTWRVNKNESRRATRKFNNKNSYLRSKGKHTLIRDSTLRTQKSKDEDDLESKEKTQDDKESEEEEEDAKESKEVESTKESESDSVTKSPTKQPLTKKKEVKFHVVDLTDDDPKEEDEKGISILFFFKR